MDPKVLHERLPGIAETAKIFANVDVTKEPAPVVPTVHYNMGGIPTNYKTEVTKIVNGKEEIVPGLLACGEAGVASVHGANRLGANSLLDLVVFGRASALVTKEKYKPGQSQPELPKNAGEESIAKIEALKNGKGTIPVAKIRREMQRNMQRNAAVYRIQKTLEEGCKKMEEVYQTYHDVKIDDKGSVWNTDLIEALELENLLRTIFLNYFSPGIPNPLLSHRQKGIKRRPCQRRFPGKRRCKLHEAHKLKNSRPEERKGLDRIQTSENAHFGRILICHSSTSQKSLLMLF